MSLKPVMHYHRRYSLKSVVNPGSLRVKRVVCLDPPSICAGVKA